MKYVFIKYKTEDESAASTNNKSSKSGFEMVMKNVLKLMKYTQGENAKKIKMCFIPIIKCLNITREIIIQFQISQLFIII